MTAKVMAAALAGLIFSAGGSNAGQLFIQITDNGTVVGTSPISTFGTASFMSTTIPEFASVSVTANGPPVLPAADLSTVTLDISTVATGFTGTHDLGVDVFQTGVSQPTGTMLSTTFSVNNLIGTPGPTITSDFFNGTGTTLGTLLNSHTFPVGTIVDKAGPLPNTLSTALTADAASYSITFTAGDQSANDTIQLKTVSPTSVPEPASIALLGVGVIGLLAARKLTRKSA